MNDEHAKDFDRQYLATWTEADPQRRRTNIERLWAADGRLVVSPLGLTLHGVDEIAAHIGRVYDHNIAGQGQRFVYDQHLEADDALLLRWSTLKPDGSVAGRGADVVFRNADGLVQSVYMFMGVQ